MALLAGATPVAAQDDAHPRGRCPTSAGGRDRRSRPDTGHLVLRDRADHARHPRRHRHQRLVAGLVRGRTTARPPSAPTSRRGRGRRRFRPSEGDLATSTRGSPRGSNAIVDHPRRRRAWRRARRPSRRPRPMASTVVPWGADPTGTAGTDYVDLRRLGHGRRGPASGRRGWPMRSAARATSCSSAARRQRRRHAAARGHQRGVRGLPGHHAADGNGRRSRHELGSSDRPAER